MCARACVVAVFGVLRRSSLVWPVHLCDGVCSISEVTKEGRLWKATVVQAVRANAAALPAVLSPEVGASVHRLLVSGPSGPAAAGTSVGMHSG